MQLAPFIPSFSPFFPSYSFLPTSTLILLFSTSGPCLKHPIADLYNPQILLFSPQFHPFSTLIHPIRLYWTAPPPQFARHSRESSSESPQQVLQQGQWLHWSPLLVLGAADSERLSWLSSPPCHYSSGHYLPIWIAISQISLHIWSQKATSFWDTLVIISPTF